MSRNVKFQEAHVYKDVAGMKMTEVVEEGFIMCLKLRSEICQSKMYHHLNILESDLNDIPEFVHEDTARSSLSNYQLARDRPRRQIVPPVRFHDYDFTEDEIASLFM